MEHLAKGMYPERDQSPTELMTIDTSFLWRIDRVVETSSWPEGSVAVADAVCSYTSSCGFAFTCADAAALNRHIASSRLFDWLWSAESSHVSSWATRVGDKLEVQPCCSP